PHRFPGNRLAPDEADRLDVTLPLLSGAGDCRRRRADGARSDGARLDRRRLHPLGLLAVPTTRLVEAVLLDVPAGVHWLGPASFGSKTHPPLPSSLNRPSAPWLGAAGEH